VGYFMAISSNKINFGGFIESMKSYFQRLFSKKFIVVLLSVVLTGGLFSFSSSDSFFEISKNIDIMVTMFRELQASYVDEFDTEEVVQKGTAKMLESLDPYTEFVPEDDVDDFKRVHLSGDYGGIGAIIQQFEENLIIAEPYEGFPAQKADLRAGDIILKVDNKEVKGKKTEELSSLLKGPKGSTVTMLIKRPNESAPLQKTMVREEIKIKNVSYYGTIEEGVGYIRLDRFLDNAYQEAKDALVHLKEKEKINSLVLDLRGNGGGILMDAVKIVNLFVKQGQLVVSQKGKVKSNNYDYYANNKPIDKEIPLIVLVDRGSASASEIVAGALQETDRAVIIGQRTFGKGLVQNTMNLPYNSLLKVTIAKYYTPSGRCIQALDYTHRNTDGSVYKVADSLITEFKTLNGRSVYDGSGIYPDIVIEPRKLHVSLATLYTQQHLFAYANYFRSKNNQIAPAKKFTMSDEAYKDFSDFVSKRDFKYKTASEDLIEELDKNSQKDPYYNSIKPEIETLRNKIEEVKSKDLFTFKNDIKEVLESEIAARYYYQRGRIESSFDEDSEIQKALEIIKNKNLYVSILKGEGDYKTIGKPGTFNRDDEETALENQLRRIKEPNKDIIED
jgi:carboxyl-terminal processing protease